jgi:hypothetical protein
MSERDDDTASEPYRPPPGTYLVLAVGIGVGVALAAAVGLFLWVVSAFDGMD